MTVSGLRETCVNAIEEGASIINLRLPGVGRGYSRRLLGRSGPIGRIVCGSSRHQVVRFEAKRVLAFLEGIDE